MVTDWLKMNEKPQWIISKCIWMITLIYVPLFQIICIKSSKHDGLINGSIGPTELAEPDELQQR
jgi:hypothetical protein